MQEQEYFTVSIIKNIQDSTQTFESVLLWTHRLFFHLKILSCSNQYDNGTPELHQEIYDGQIICTGHDIPFATVSTNFDKRRSQCTHYRNLVNLTTFFVEPHEFLSAIDNVIISLRFLTHIEDKQSL